MSTLEHEFAVIDGKLDDALRPESWMEDFALSPDEIAAMEDAEFIVDDLIISCHITVIAAQPGRGKTSILMHEAAGMVAKGYRVSYVNMDCGAADVKYWSQQAENGGFKMITPHFFGADGINQWVAMLHAMAENDDLSKLVIVVDTLKKIADMVNKGSVRQTFSILRALTAKGATVVCAAHCNKYRDDGELVFEGTGDVMSDCDNLIYLDSMKDDSGVRKVSTKPSDKVRGIFHPRSWEIRQDRSVVALSEFEDVTAIQQAQTQVEQDQTAIEVITQGITADKHLRSELQEHCRERGVNKREFDRVIKRYCQGKTDAKTVPLWRNEPQMKDNASYYILLNSPPLNQRTNRPTAPSEPTEPTGGTHVQF